MTAVHPDLSLTRATPAANRLLGVVRFDTAVCLASGLVLLVAAGPLADVADVASRGAVRAIGAFLLAYGVGLLWLTTTEGQGLRRGVLATAIADVLWTVGSVAVAVTMADLSGPGRALIAAQGLVVLGIGEAKLLGLRRDRAGA